MDKFTAPNVIMPVVFSTYWRYKERGSMIGPQGCWAEYQICQFVPDKKQPRVIARFQTLEAAREKYPHVVSEADVLRESM